MKLKLLFLPRYEVNPNIGKPTQVSKYPPLGIATLTAFLKENNISVEQDDVDIKVFHHNLTNNENRRIKLEIFNDKKRIDEFIQTKNDPGLEKEAEKILKLTDCKGFDVIGLSLNIADNPSSTAIALVLAKILKERYGSTIITGQTMKKEILKELLQTGLIDYGIISTPYFSIAEVSLLNFCRMSEKDMDLTKIPGIVHVKDGKLVYTKKDEEFNNKEKFIVSRPDFDDLPLDLYINKKKYEVDWICYKSDVAFLPYFFIRGCSNNCAFCTYSMCSWHAKDPKKVAEDLEYLSKKYKTKCFFFLNTEINPTYEYAERVAEEIIKKNLDIIWSDCATVNNIDKNLLKKLKEAGAVRLVFGVESGCPKIMKYVNKPFTLNQAEEILKEASKLKILTQIDVICGFPYETEQDVDATIKFIKKNRESIMAVDLNKFYLNGLMQSFPERYGIKRLQEEEKFYGNWSTIPFDEIYGLSWEEKVKQTIHFFNEIQKAIEEEFKPPMLNFNDIGDVFFAILNPSLIDKVFKNKNRG